MCSRILGERLFFHISSLLTPTLGGKKHWLLAVEESMENARSHFLKEKSELKNVMMGLIKNLKTMHDIQLEYLQCDNVRENIDFENIFKQEEMGMKFKYTIP